MDKKLNNLIKFKEFGKLDKLENKPGKKVIEGLNNIKSFKTLVDEGFFTDTKVGNTLRKGAGFLDSGEKWDKFWEENQDQIKRWMNVYNVEIDEDSIHQEAEQDNFQGVVGLNILSDKNVEVIYRPEGTFNWKSPGGGIGK